ncbi:pericentrin isoform X1 [Heterocephalus glaber]|uniref:Pericentrin isoform X1 n=1 Tax=Heterocephalus glaber TaxID=10181 RepID=A0AAX6STL0_HETGA|nr:pericentrin isoform X1 [Heterocephalus glaber]
MEEDEQEQRRRKVEAGRATLAHFRQRKTKGDCVHSKKKTAKRKGPPVDAPVQEESPLVTQDGGLLQGSGACRSTAGSDSPDRARGAFATQEQDQDCESMGIPEDKAGQQQQPQAAHSLELEALRLSLNNMHTAQLELTQANLQKEKETALTELREMLNGRRAQELALLQSRQQSELELVREQHAREKEAMALRCGQEMAELKEKLQSEVDKNAQMIETLKQDWESERELCLENLRKELSARHQSEMEDLQNQFQKELAEQRAELEKVFQDKTEAEVSLKSLEAQHQAAVRKVREDLQLEHCQYLENLELKFREKEKEKQLELENLQASYEDLKAQSQEEIRRLWSQLESAKTSREEMHEPWPPPLAGVLHMEQLEHLRQEFAQQQQQDRAQHESELEQLRLYFENKLRDAEKTYQEDLSLFQQRLQEAKEDSLPGSVEISSSCAFLEDTSDREGKEHPDQLNLQLEQQEGSVACLQPGPKEKHRLGSDLCSSLHVLREEDESDRGLVGPEVLEWEPFRAVLSDQHSQEPAQVQPQCMQDTAVEMDAQVTARVLGLEAEHKLKLSLLQTELKEEIELLKMENRNLREKLQHETRLRGHLESVKFSLVEDHQAELNKAEEKIKLLKQEFKKKEAEWEITHEDLKREAEEKVTSMLLELQEKAELEKQSIISRFELREAEMKSLQDQQAAQILDLERSLTEQQGRLRQLEQGLAGYDALLCSRCGREPPVAQHGGHPIPLREEDCALQLILAQNRFLEERKEIVEKFAEEQDAFLRDAQEKHAQELQLLQQRHQQRLLSLRTELESKHQAELAELMATLESEQQVLLETRVAELQMKHAAEISALETRHLSNLDALESCYLSEMHTVRDEHRRALELLQTDLEEQLRKKDSFHQVILTQELEKLKQKHDAELQSAKDSLRTEMSTIHAEQLEVLARELQGTHQGKFESEQKAAVSEEEVHRLEHESVPGLSQEQDLPPLQEDSQTQQLKGQVLSLSREIEECRTELERLQQRRERENQEGATLISMLRADVDLSQGERRALHDALRRLLGLFGETLKAAVALKSRIGERVGFLLDHTGTTAADQALSTAPALEEVWSDDAALLELDRTLPEGAEMSSLADISSHVCESFFMSPESTLECEQPIRRVYQSLSMAVDGLLEMAVDSSRQVEEARQLHSHFEKEFSHKNEETAQVVQKHQQLLECLQAEGAAKAALALELHTAEGLLEGLRVEKADLQEALARKEASEQQLVLELESLGQQLQQAAKEQAGLREEHSLLWSQKEAQAVEAEARAAGTRVTAAHRDSALQKEVESLTREQLEARRQAEKDRAALLSQMQILESELEDQLRQHQGCARQAEQAATLKQQLAALDKHLRSQRQFMDEQAAEREHEREEFQQEIQKLEGQLRQAARLRPPGPHDQQQYVWLDEKVELLREKLREKSDGYNELVIKKELADRQVLIQEEEIKRLEEINAHTREQMALLQKELEKQKEMVKELQDKEALTEPQTSELMPAPMSQPGPDEGRCPVLPLGSLCEDPEGWPEAVQRVFLQDGDEVVYHRSSEVEELKSIIENLQENQERLQKDKAEEIEQLHEVIEKLQAELTLLGPVVHELSDRQADSLHSELLCFQAEGPGGQALQGELEAALVAKETLAQLLADQAHGHSQALEGLQQRLQAAEEAATRQLAEHGHNMALREAEVKGMTSRIQEFEAVLKEKEAVIVQRDLEIEAMNKQKEAHFIKLEAVLSALARFRHALEQQPPASSEPPELQWLRAQCVCLSRQLQMLNQRFLGCQVDLDKQQARGVPETHPHPHVDTKSADLLEQGGGSKLLASDPHGRGSQDDPQPAKVLAMLKDAEFHKPESVVSVLTVCQRQLEAELLMVKNEMCLSMEDDPRAPGKRKGKEKWMEDGHLQKVDLIAQVQQLQEKLNCLAHSVALQDMDPIGSRFQQPSALTYLSENSSHGRAEADTLPPVHSLNSDETTWDLTDTTKNQDALSRNEMPNSLIQEKIEPQDGRLSLQTSMHDGSLHAEEAEPLKDPGRVQELSSWSSPEVFRKDSSLEYWPSIPLTPCSGAVSLRNAEASPQDPSWLLQSSLGGSTEEQTPLWTATLPSDQPVGRIAAEKDVEDYIATSFDSRDVLRSPPPGLEGRSDESEKMFVSMGGATELCFSTDPVVLIGDGLGCGVRLNLGSRGPATPTTGAVTPAPVSRGFQQPPGVVQAKEIHTRHVKALLQMVCDESHQILALSESRDLPSTLSKGEPCTPLTCFPSEGQGLLEVAPKKGEKELLDSRFDWRAEFLEATQMFEKEQNMVQAELQPRPCVSDPWGHSLLCRKLEKVAQEQGDPQEKPWEHLRLPDRSSLLSEIQALRAQLRMTHLQNQEKLQQLCAALTSAEARSSRQEHQLRRQVELLAYKVEQEKCIASDLQKTLSEEQERARGVRQLLAVEQSAVQDLQSELRECQQENARLLESLGEAQHEVLQLRSLLDGKESDLKAALEELEQERGKERALQARQEEEQLRHLQREGQSTKALEELKVSLEKQFTENNQLCVALKHEQTVRDNLQQELQIEHSRCEALLAQERGRLSELQRSLEAEKNHARELSEALQHERLLTEQLSRGAQHPQAHHAMLRKLKAEKARVLELQVALQVAQQQVLQAQQQLEAQVQEHYTELGREKEQELELQRQRNEHKIEQLQQTVRELQSKEEVPLGSGPFLDSLELSSIWEQQQGLEKIRQQLLCVAGLLTSFVNRTMDRTLNDWTLPSEKAVSSLVQTLQGLKSELSMSASSQKKMAAELQVQLVDVLLRDNDSLTKAISTVTQEKAELCKAMSRLEKTLRHHVQKGCILSRSSRPAWRQDRTVSQSWPQHPDSGRPTLAASEEANTCNIKVEKLYLHYLRAESFRKALIYQKKYLLLLIGGFQDSEQETLSMIAHLGVFPSRADKKMSTSRPFTRFRTAVRVVIAVLRLRFLVKKWQEVDRKGASLLQGKAPHPGPRVPRKQLSLLETRESPPTQDVPSHHARDSACRSPSGRERSSPSPSSRLERPLTASQDPEHSLTEYIHHLEMIQQRLGGAPPDSTSKKSYRQKIKQ